MTKITVTLVLVSFIATATAVEGGQYILACNHDDVPCLRNATTLFLQKTKDGNDIFHIQGVDPLHLKSSKYVIPGATFKFRNISVFGLKDAYLNDFKLDMDTQSVEFTTTVTLSMVAYLDIFMTGTKVLMPPKSSVYSSLDVYAMVTVKYNYELYQGLILEHFKIGPESLDCLVVPVLSKQNARNGLRRSSNGLGIADDINGVRAEAVCEVIKDAQRVVVHNMREITAIMPASSIIKDIRQPLHL